MKESPFLLEYLKKYLEMLDLDRDDPLLLQLATELDLVKLNQFDLRERNLLNRIVPGWINC